MARDWSTRSFDFIATRFTVPVQLNSTAEISRSHPSRWRMLSSLTTILALTICQHRWLLAITKAIDHRHRKSARHNCLSSSGFRLLDFGFRIPDYGFRLPDSGLWISASGLWISDSGLWISGSGFRLPDSGFRIPASGFRIMDFGVRILDFRLWIPTSGLPDSDFWILDFGFWLPDFGIPGLLRRNSLQWFKKRCRAELISNSSARRVAFSWVHFYQLDKWSWMIWFDLISAQFRNGMLPESYSISHSAARFVCKCARWIWCGIFRTEGTSICINQSMWELFLIWTTPMWKYEKRKRKKNNNHSKKELKKKFHDFLSLLWILPPWVFHQLWSTAPSSGSTSALMCPADWFFCFDSTVLYSYFLKQIEMSGMNVTFCVLK